MGPAPSAKALGGSCPQTPAGHSSPQQAQGHPGTSSEYRQRLKLVLSSPTIYIDSGALTFRQRHPFTLAEDRLHEAVDIVGADKIV